MNPRVCSARFPRAGSDQRAPPGSPQATSQSFLTGTAKSESPKSMVALPS